MVFIYRIFNTILLSRRTWGFMLDLSFKAQDLAMLNNQGAILLLILLSKKMGSAHIN